MSSGLGKVLDYRGMPMSEAVDEMQKRGVALNEAEMKLMEGFLINFHQHLASN